MGDPEIAVQRIVDRAPVTSEPSEDQRSNLLLVCSGEIAKSQMAGHVCQSITCELHGCVAKADASQANAPEPSPR